MRRRTGVHASAASPAPAANCATRSSSTLTTPKLADAIHFALVMDPVERSARMRRMRQIVKNFNIYRWAADFIFNYVILLHVEWDDGAGKNSPRALRHLFRILVLWSGGSEDEHCIVLFWILAHASVPLIEQDP